MPDPSEQFWRDLISFIDEGKVIPVIGPELVTVDDGGTQVPLYSWLARKLAERIDLPLADLPEPFDLNDVVAQSLLRGDERDMFYPRLREILRDAPSTSTPSPALTALAGIQGFKLFVSLTFDSQLAAALSQARHGAAPTSVVYATNAVHDLPQPYEELQDPLVFQLLGRASSSPDYVICDDDLLEFLHALQDGQRHPVNLFDALRTNHLLFLGCGFGDWLARFFLRTARGMELSQRRKRLDILADARAKKEPSLTMFLSSFDHDSCVLDMVAGAFVQELSQRWKATHPDPLAGTASLPESSAPVIGPREGAVFVSYASENFDAAKNLVEGLKAAKLDVWWDKGDLKVGDKWALSIQRGIDRCALFLPVISRKAVAKENNRRYFWTEWRRAIDRAERMAPDEEFIVPVVVDQMRLDQSDLHEAIRSKQGANLPGGELTPEFAKRLEEIVHEYHRRYPPNTAL